MPPLTRDQIGLAKSVDLLSLIADDTRLHRLTQHEFAGPCPFCGGNDRFHLQPESGRWFCRQCTGEPADGGWKDAIDYVQRRHGLTFPDAVAQLSRGGLPPAAVVRAPPATVRSRPVWSSPAWQSSARSWLHQAQRRLNSAEGALGQAYLLGRRLLPATWQAWGLGLIKAWHPLRRRRLPAILLPWQQEERLCALQYRFIEPNLGKSERFSQRRGGQRLLFGRQRLAGRGLLLLVEGELNALSLWQVAGDLLDVLSWGPQGNLLRPRVSQQIVALAVSYQRLLLWSDDAEVACKGFSQLQAHGLPPGLPTEAVCSPQGLDANDLLQREVLLAFVQSLIAG